MRWNLAKLLHVLAAVMVLLSLVGCGASRTVRHLASDASLIVPGRTTQAEVVSFLGTPDQQLVRGDNGEQVWVYYQVRQSFFRTTPYIGDRLGSEEYDTISVVFAGEMVSACQYRLLSEAEFKQSGFAGGGVEQPGNE